MRVAELRAFGHHHDVGSASVAPSPRQFPFTATTTGCPTSSRF